MCGVPHHAAPALRRAGWSSRASGSRSASRWRTRARPRASSGARSCAWSRPGTQLEAHGARGRRERVRAGAGARARRRSARPGSRRRPASSWSPSGRGPAAGSALRDELGGRAPARDPGAARGAELPAWLSDAAEPRARIPRARARRRAGFDARAARRELLAPLRRAHPGGLRLRGRCRRPRRPAAPPCATCARPRSATSRTSPASARATRADGLVHRRAHAPQPGAGREPGRRQPRGARCSACSTRRATRDGLAPRCATGSCARWPALERDPGPPGRGRGAGLPHASSAARCARRSRRVQDLDRIVGRVTLGTAQPARPRGAWRARCARCPRPPAALGEVRGAPAAPARLKDARPAARRRRRRRGARSSTSRPPPLKDGGLIRDGVDPELDELRERQPRRPHHHRRHRGARAAAHRHRVAQGPLQPRVRLLHRGQQVQPRRWCPPDYIRKQTIASGERFVTPELKEYEEKVLTRRRAHPGARRRRSSRRCARGWPRRPAALQQTSRAAAVARRAGVAGRGRLPLRLRQAAHRPRATSSTYVDGRHPGDGARAAPTRSWPTTCAWATRPAARC